MAKVYCAPEQAKADLATGMRADDRAQFEVIKALRAENERLRVAIHSATLLAKDYKLPPNERINIVLDQLQACEPARAAKTMSDWQNIETAPKDGTRILLWIMPTAIAMSFAWENGRWMGDDYPLNMAWPTHWMPLPAPPRAALKDA